MAILIGLISSDLILSPSVRLPKPECWKPETPRASLRQLNTLRSELRRVFSDAESTELPSSAKNLLALDSAKDYIRSIDDGSSGQVFVIRGRCLPREDF
jgi:hypothetical protein